MRAAKPDALYIFLPGGMGINFIKQFVAAGLSKDVPADHAGIRAPTRTSSAPVGDAMLGTLRHRALGARPRQRRPTRNSSPRSRRSTSACRRCTRAQGYDTALLIDAAVRDVKGKIEDIEARAQGAARRRSSSRCAARSSSTATSIPIQNYYLRVVGKDAQGRIVNKTIGTVFKDHGDAYVQDCTMK